MRLVEMCDMHLVIFLAKKYKTEYRTSTNRIHLLDKRPGTTPFNKRPGVDIASRPIERNGSKCYAPQTKILENGTSGWACVCEKGRVSSTSRLQSHVGPFIL